MTHFFGSPTIGLAGLATNYNNLHIQSHISECCGEVAFVKQLFPGHCSDASIFDEMGLLTNKVWRECFV